MFLKIDEAQISERFISGILPSKHSVSDLSRVPAGYLWQSTEVLVVMFPLIHNSNGVWVSGTVS